MADAKIPVDENQVVDNQTPAVEAPVTPEVKAPEAKVKDPNSGWQKRVDKLTHQNHELKGRVEAFEKWKSEQEAKSQVQATPTSFKSKEEEITYHVQKALEQDRTQRSAESEQAAFVNDIAQRLEAASEIARKDIPDFDEVVTPDRQVMIESDAVLFIANSDVGGHLRYELMKDPNKVAMLNSLPESVRQARLVRMESDIISKLEKNPSSRSQGTVAPTPPSPVRGNSSAAPVKDPEKMSMAEFGPAFRAKMAAKKKR